MLFDTKGKRNYKIDLAKAILQGLFLRIKPCKYAQNRHFLRGTGITPKNGDFTELFRKWANDKQLCLFYDKNGCPET